MLARRLIVEIPSSQVGTLAWTIAHIAADCRLSRRVYAQLLNRASVGSVNPESGGPTFAAARIGQPANELDLLEQCMQETNRVYGGLQVFRQVTSSNQETDSRSFTPSRTSVQIWSGAFGPLKERKRGALSVFLEGLMHKQVLSTAGLFSDEHSNVILVHSWVCTWQHFGGQPWNGPLVLARVT
jgi:hypothetical protein